MSSPEMTRQDWIDVFAAMSEGVKLVGATNPASLQISIGIAFQRAAECLQRKEDLRKAAAQRAAELRCQHGI